MQLDNQMLLRKWVHKGDNDLHMALLALPKGALLGEEIGFHCQQAAEKLLKAILILQHEPVPIIHDFGNTAGFIANENKHFRRMV